MKELLSTGASRAWLGVALAGLVVVALVFALALIPRLGAGQRMIDAAEPAFTDARVEGTRAGVLTMSQYVDIVDPLLTRRGGASEQVPRLIGYLRRTLGLSTAQVRKILRREAPHTEALTRALPLDAVAAEIPRLTAYLATIMGMSEEELAAILERDFPRISQSLTALAITSETWYDVPGVDGLTRLSRDKPVRTVPGVRKYLRDDLVPLTVAQKENFQSLAAAGGIGYIPFLLLVLGLGLLAFGVLGAKRARNIAPGELSWGVVAATGVLLLLVVVGAQYFPRLNGAQEMITAFEPAFTEERVRGVANGVDTIHEAIAFGDPLMTPLGGAARETPRLYRFVARRTGRRTADVRRALRRRAPRTTALLSAISLTEVGREVPQLLAYLDRALRMSRREVVATLRKRTPDLAQALLTTPDVARAWNAIPGTAQMTRFDGVTSVRTMTEFDAYLREDLIPVLVSQRENFTTLAGGQPVDKLAPVLLLTALFLMLYGGMMMQLVVRRY
ncbi:MAG TPA: hypothetical protein VGR11_16870 [Solirubrobacteraceae bacterium]|nr:hypothetical protein [Solirubrobacteraceae bacterium]